MLKKIKYILIAQIGLIIYLYVFSIHADQLIEKRLTQANIYLDYGKVNQALRILESVKIDNNSNFSLLVTYGRVSLRQREFKKARDYFEDAIFSSEMNDDEAYLGVARAYLEIGQFKNAYKNLRPLLKNSYKISETELLLTEIEMRMGYLIDAKKRILKLLDNKPNDPNVVIGYAKYLLLNEDPYVAMDFLEKNIIKNYDAPLIYVYLGSIKGMIGLNKEKKKLFFKASELYSNLGNKLRATILLETANSIKINKNNIPIEPPINLNEEKELVKQEENIPKLKKEIEENNLKSDKEEKNSHIVNIKLSKSLNTKRLDVSWLNEASENNNFNPFKTKEVFFGSGFLIDGGDYLITNYHVIKGTKIVLVRTGDGKESAAKTAFYDEEKDLAVLKLINKLGNKNEVFSIKDFEDPKPGSDALVIGYPMPDFFGSNLPSITEGIVAKETGLGDNPNNFLITSKINSGNSGGPIINQKGCLIGIAVGKLDTRAILKSLDMLPEDMNIGIKASNASKILGSSTNNNCSLKKNYNRVELYEIMLPRVALIIAGN